MTTRTILALGLIALLSACAVPQTATRETPFEAPRKISDTPIIKTFVEPDAQAVSDAQAVTRTDTAQAPVAVPPSVRVEQISVVVPKTLIVSEVNHYLPAADIVWREDPMGDRHAQVRQIVQSALERGTASLDGDTPVSLYVQLMRFHALTQKARYTVGGVHSIKFGLAVRDLNTGQLIGEPRVIEADLQAFGGAQAIRAEQKGQTQKVRITDHLAEVIRKELAQPGSWQNPQLGIIQAMNKF